jgi:hypothetical protein
MAAGSWRAACGGSFIEAADMTRSFVGLTGQRNPIGCKRAGFKIRFIQINSKYAAPKPAFSDRHVWLTRHRIFNASATQG